VRADPPENLEFFLTLALTASKVWPLVQREFSAEDVDPVHWGLLFHVGARDDVTPSELAAETGLSATTVRDNIQALVDRGLVERDPNPQDARSYYVRPTKQGRSDLERGIVASRRLEKRIAARFEGTEALRASLYALMAVLADLSEQDELADRARRVETVLARRGRR